jgi:two-component system, cell cycle sensor histidine kinase PleC
MPQAATANCIGTGECLRRYGSANAWSCETPCNAAIQEAGDRLCRRIVFYSAMAIIAIAAIVGLVALQLRQNALNTAWSNAANLSAAFEEQVHRVLDSVSGAMERIKQSAEAQGSHFDIAEWTKLAPELASEPIGAAIVGPDGTLRSGSLGPNSDPEDFATSDCFLFHRNNPGGGLYISKPALDPATKHVTLHLSRRLDKPGGGFAGMLVFSFDPDFLTPLQRAVDLGATGVMTLAGLDGGVRARHAGPLVKRLSPGVSLAGAPAIDGAAQANRGAYTGWSGLDGIDQIVTWRRVPGYPLVVMAGLGKDEFLAGPTRLALIILGLGGAAILLSGAMAAMVVQEISSRVRYEIEANTQTADLKDANQSLTAQHEALVKTASELASERINLQEMNERLVLAQQQSEAANRAKSAFLANMSHELRTPLNAIIGFSEIIRDKLLGPDTPAYFEYAGDINSAGHHLLAIVNDILDLAKIEAGKVDFSESIADLGSILTAGARAVKTQAKSGNLKILKDYPAEGIQVRCDEVRLRQVFINVLSNAVKFTPPGGQISISANLEADGGICVAVKDTGIGMMPSEIEAAFEKFQQIDNSMTKRFEGTGLGLPLAKQLIEIHGGSIDISSEPSVGSEVRIHLPAARVVEVDAGVARMRASVTALSHAGDGPAVPTRPAAAA